MSSIKIDLKAVNTRHHTSKVYFTYEQLRELPEWPSSPLIELIQGEMFMPPSPNIYHHDISARLVSILREQLGEITRVFNAPVDVVLSNEDVIIPDIFIVNADNYEIITETNITGVPDLIVEILSTNREHDLVIKKNLYERYGVKEYWIVDPENKTITLFVRKLVEGTEKLLEINSTELGSAFSSRMYPELDINTSEIF
jgi:Uma2 family endonuclease